MKGNLPTLETIDVNGKAVLVRGDFDVDDGSNPRADSIRTIVNYLKEKGAARIRVIGHTETKYDLASQLRTEFPGVEFESGIRNNPGEKENNEEYAKLLAGDYEIYVNEAFATSHRKHASIMGVPKIIREKGGAAVIGLRFEKELEMLSTVWKHTGRRILVIGGTKIDDKQKFVENMKDKFVAVLTGGLLPGTDLRPDGLDISDATIEKYVGMISTAEVILAAGVMGKYEDQNCAKGTETILKAIANNTNAYKVAGGGDIEMAISTYELTEKFNWISVGGGAMLVYLSEGTLPGLQALIN
jgi:phosphoglycerate kinase